jgi:hydrogenase maturation protease
MAMTSRPTPAGTLVLGLGNPLMGDDGLGLAVLARLVEEWEFYPEVTLVDGGTWGMNLLPLIEDTEKLILIDAIHTGADPGTIVELERAALPRYLDHKLSPHQIDLKEVLALAELRGTMPDCAVAIGAEPATIELMFHLSPMLEQRVEDLALAVVNRLAHWGHSCQRRAVTSDA